MCPPTRTMRARASPLPLCMLCFRDSVTGDTSCQRFQALRHGSSQHPRRPAGQPCARNRAALPPSRGDCLVRDSCSAGGRAPYVMPLFSFVFSFFFVESNCLCSLLLVASDGGIAALSRRNDCHRLPPCCCRAPMARRTWSWRHTRNTSLTSK